MTEARLQGGPAATPTSPDRMVAEPADDPLNDAYAWGAIHLDDGRAISIAWLRGWAGAVAGRWRDG